MTKSVSSIFNYLLKDPLLDYLKIYGKTRGFYTDEYYNKSLKEYSFSDFIIQLGIQWEEKVIAHLKTKVDISVVERNENAFENTLEFINKNVPVIYQGFVKDENFHGYIDLLVHIDCARDIFEGINDDVLSFFKRKEMNYIPIDIKLSYNEDKNKYYQKYIETQLYLYGHMLYKQLGKETNIISGFIISRQELNGKIKMKSLKLTDFLLLDALKASSWLDKVKNEGQQWNVFQPHIPELYPNLKNQYDSKWKNVKKIIAKSVKEISLLYFCGLDIREKCFSKGVYSYENPEFITVLNSCFKSDCSTLKTIKEMILKKEDTIVQKECPAKGKILFIDIENVYNHYKLVDDNYKNLKNDLIVQIGVGFETVNKRWIYKSFDSYDEHLNNDSEEKILSKFKELVEFYQTEHEHVTLVCYTKAENRLFEKLKLTNVTILDLHEEIKNIKLKELYSYSLKSVIKALKERKMVDIDYDDCYIKDGLTAMTLVLKKDKTDLTNVDRCELRKYNEMDCKCMYELFKIIYN
jgi:hypothetical protein